MHTELLPGNQQEPKKYIPPVHNALDKINSIEKLTGFFYIGKNPKKIDFLIKPSIAVMQPIMQRAPFLS